MAFDRWKGEKQWIQVFNWLMMLQNEFELYGNSIKKNTIMNVLSLHGNANSMEKSHQQLTGTSQQYLSDKETPYLVLQNINFKKSYRIFFLIWLINDRT